MTAVRVVALGSRTVCDDEAGLLAVEDLSDRANVVMAGRPGPSLIDLLSPETPTILVDVVDAGTTPGRVLTIPLRDLPGAAIDGQPVSSHGLGPAEALRLAIALGRPLPEGTFVGVQGQNFRPGTEMSEAVTRALPALRSAIEAAIAALQADPESKESHA